MDTIPLNVTRIINRGMAKGKVDRRQAPLILDFQPGAQSHGGRDIRRTVHRSLFFRAGEFFPSGKILHAAWR